MMPIKPRKFSPSIPNQPAMVQSASLPPNEGALLGNVIAQGAFGQLRLGCSCRYLMTNWFQPLMAWRLQERIVGKTKGVIRNPDQNQGMVYMTLLLRSSAAFAAILALGAQATAAEQVTFGTNWLAQPEHGGFYQSVADGTYAACGLDVTIAQGGPQVNNRALLLAGKIQFHMGGNLLEAFSAVEQDIPVRVVATSFQKEPQVLMTHPGQGLDTWEELKSAEQFILGDA